MAVRTLHITRERTVYESGTVEWDIPDSVLQEIEEGELDLVEWFDGNVPGEVVDDAVSEDSEDTKTTEVEIEEI